MDDLWLELEGKNVIITGAASGIGREIAFSFARQGCNIIIADIKDGEEVIENLPESSRGHLFVKTDVTNEESIKAMVSETINNYNKIDILVNNAGVNIPRLLVDPEVEDGKYELNEKEFDFIVNVNQKGVFLVTQAVVRQMVKEENGVVINMSSECNLEGSKGQSTYAATKAAVYSFTRSWAKELGKYGIRVVGVAPGIIEKTPLRSLEYEKALAYTRGKTVKELRAGYKDVSVPLNREGTLEEIANLVCFLGSERASYIHGTTYNISGGKSRG